MKQILLALPLLLLLACNPSPKEHPYLVKTIGSPDYGNVQTIFQDKDEQLWVGTTENGLYRYDGKTFARYLTTDGLPTNDITALYQAAEGTLWIGTKKGLVLYKGKTFDSLVIPFPKNLKPNKNPFYKDSHWIYQIMPAQDGKIWLATLDGVYAYDGQGFSHLNLDAIPMGVLTDNDKAERILQDKAGNIWLGARTNPGVYKYDGKTLTHFNLDTLYQNGPKPKPHNWAWPQVQDKNGNIWFSNWGGAYRFDGKSFTRFTKKDGLPGMVTKIIEDRQGNIWLGGDGLTRYDGKTFTHFGTAAGMTNPGVWSILEDKAGRLWVGTRATGLYLLEGDRLEPYSVFKR